MSRFLKFLFILFGFYDQNPVYKSAIRATYPDISYLNSRRNFKTSEHYLPHVQWTNSDVPLSSNIALRIYFYRT
jgi:hypothetical protein